MQSPHPHLRVAARAALLVLAASALDGCTVLAVAGAATSVAVTGASLAVDGAVGAVKLTGKAAGLAADAVLPSSSSGK